jgi:hypothetical protein
MYCPRCGKQVDEAGQYCRFCGNPLGTSESTSVVGQPLSAKLVPTAKGVASDTDRKETTFYSDDRGVRITNARLMVPNTTYAMANITSVKTDRIGPKYSGAVLTAVLGFVLVVARPSLGSLNTGILGVVLLGAGIAWGLSLKPDYHLRISSAAGDSSALSAKDKAYIEKVAQAIHEAMIHRG